MFCSRFKKLSKAVVSAMLAAEPMRNLAGRGFGDTPPLPSPPPLHTLFDKNLKEWARFTGVDRASAFSLCCPAVNTTFTWQRPSSSRKKSLIMATVYILRVWADCWRGKHTKEGAARCCKKKKKKYQQRQQQPMRTVETRNVIICHCQITHRIFTSTKSISRVVNSSARARALELVVSQSVRAAFLRLPVDLNGTK